MYFIIPTVLLYTMGWLVKVKRVTWLISGYNTSSKAEQEKYDLDKLCDNFGRFLYVIATICLGLSITSIIFADYIDLIIWIGVVILMIVIILGIIYLNTNNRVMKT